MSNLTDRTTALLDKPSLEGLSYALRNLATVAPKHKWLYRDHCHCAMGLAHELWPSAFDVKDYVRTKDMVQVFGMDALAAAEIFISCRNKIATRSVTPADVASAIDAYLATT